MFIAGNPKDDPDPKKGSHELNGYKKDSKNFYRNG
jgi:hypothetical protein